ncbi:DUF2489 domain-containing protein [Alteromonadaceae bacterium BrNp21-10]|nr:DUF2489 domain-containing protein [Alteromonadaceae bacterium BrNp21-10]
MLTIIIILAIIIIAALAFYAGRLLFQLNKQTNEQNAVRNTRIANISESIQTIAFAMSQQQCDLSEGCIRLYKLLEAVPVTPRPDYASIYSNLYALYDQIKHMPTHEERQQQSKNERRKMDLQREELEAKLESNILKEIEQLKHFVV